MQRLLIAVFALELLNPHIAAASPAAVAVAANSASAKVKGPVVFEVAVIEGDVDVVAGAKDKVSIEVKGGKSAPVKLRSSGNRMTAEFGSMHGLQRGDVRIELPPGSEVHVRSISGDVNVKGLAGNVEVTAVSGDVEILGATDVKVEAVSGDVKVRDATGSIDVETVSGDADLASAKGVTGKLEFETTSGNLVWAGTCGSGCRMDVETLSGRATLHVDAKSSFELGFESFSGGVTDKLGVTTVRESKGGRHGRGPGSDLAARYGKGAGKISVETHSGKLVLVEKK